MPPGKRDALSATSAFYRRLGSSPSVSVEVACYGRGSDWLCRLTSQDSKPAPGARLGDAYHPPADLGFLWLRHWEGRTLASGAIAPELFDGDELDDFIEWLLGKLGLPEVQPVLNVSSIDSRKARVFDGESVDLQRQ